MKNDNLPMVSIGIPTYNRANGYLREAIQSAVDQTYPNIEIIISDNCSSDTTTELVNSFSNPRIKYHRHPTNIGAIKNFNYCLEQSKGTYFLMLHDDDKIDGDHIASCLQAVKGGKEVGIILTGVRIIDKDNKTIAERLNQIGGLSFADQMLFWFENKTAFYLCNTLYNTKRLKEIGGFKSKKNLYCDTVATVRLLAKFGNADVKDVKASFRGHGENMGKTYRVVDWCDDSLYLLDIICHLTPDKKDVLRRRGMEYFCRQNYGIAASFVPKAKLLWAYWIVAKKFKFS